VLDVCLDSLVLASDSSQLANDCVKEIKDINRKLLKLKRHERNTRKEMRKELRYLNKEVRVRHQKAITEVLSSAQIVACTLTGCMSRVVDKEAFDLVVVDEAAQATECATWSALMKGKRAVLCGDHLQLPPTVISDEAERKGLGVPLFERLHKRFGSNIAQMLNVQYRMNEAIMKWSSDEFYRSKLVAHDSVASHTLSELKQVEEAKNSGKNRRGNGEEDMELGECVLHMVDTTGLEMFERQDEENASYSNDGESEAVVKHVRDLLDLGLCQKDIGVIAPYSAQVSLLKQLCSNENLKDVEVSTVDGFQGREKEAIILSTVRSNESSTVGFLADPRRMNVAVTRARRHCSLVCDSETISNDKMLKGLVEYFMDNGEYTFAESM
jgi:predicted DNA helicase